MNCFWTFIWIVGPRKAELFWLKPAPAKDPFEVWLDLKRWPRLLLFSLASHFGPKCQWINVYCPFSFGLKFVFYIPGLSELFDVFLLINLIYCLNGSLPIPFWWDSWSLISRDLYTNSGLLVPLFLANCFREDFLSTYCLIFEACKVHGNISLYGCWLMKTVR